jgi:hypothetical protein
MKSLKFLAAMLVAAVSLAGCGGGGTNTLTGNATGGGTTGSTVATVQVTASAPQIAADGSTSSTITATVKDSNQNFVKDVTVAFSANAGGLAVANGGKTDANGAVTATLTAAGAAAGTTITVTAAAGTVSGTATVGVVASQQTITLSTDSTQIPSDGTKAAVITALLKNAANQVVAGVPVTFSSSSGSLAVTQGTTDAQGRATATVDTGGDPTNRRITVTATASSTTSTVPVDVTGTTLSLTGPASLVQGTQATYTVLLTNSAGRGISNTAVAVTSSAGNTLSAATVTTDFSGQATFRVTGAVAGSDTLRATALGLVAQQAISVSSQSFTFSAPAAAAKINLGASQSVQVTWLSGGTPQVGQTVTFSTTRGTLSASQATTDANGQASVTISSTTAGPAVIQASGTAVSAQVQVDFVATTPTQVNVQASPSSIKTQGQSTITAVVRDAQNNLVEGRTVAFTLTDTTGGSLSTASAVTDAQGRAQTTYSASTTASATNGVRVDATVQGTAPAVTAFATLTVGGQAVFLSLGTGNLINSENAAQYSVDYAVQALDAQGSALGNASIVVSVVSLEYVKGQRVWNGKIWVTVPSTSPNSTCLSEDVNFNGILDGGEDFNTNGKLDPGNVASVTPPSGTTNSVGTYLFKVVYPKDHAYYVKVRLTATATVQGTQSSTSTEFLLPGAVEDFNTETKAPPGLFSPFGTGTTCPNPL